MGHFKNNMERKSKIITICFLLFCNFLVGQNSESKINELYDNGYYYFYYGKYEDAIEHFENALKIDSNHYKSNLYLGLSLVNIKKYREGLIYLEKPLLLDSVEIIHKIYSIRGSVYFDISEFKLSIEYHTKSLELKLESDNFFFRGQSYNRIGEFEKAITDFEMAIELGETTSEVYFERAVSYYKLNNYEKAILDIQKGIEKGGTFEEIDYYLGEIYFEYQYFQKAINHFSNYLRRPDDKINNIMKLHSIFKTGMSYYFLGKYTEAMTNFNEILKNEPEYVGAYIFKGMTYISLNNFVQARENLEKGLKIEPENCLVTHQMGNLEHLNNNTKEGNFYLNKSKEIAFQQNNDFVLFGLAESYFKFGDTLNALNCLNKAISVNSFHFKAILLRIELNSYFLPKTEVEILNDFDLLINTFKESKQITAYYFARKAIFLFELGKLNESLIELNSAINLDSFSEYFALKAIIKTNIELTKTHTLNLNRSEIPVNVQESILKDIDIAIQSNHRKKDAFLLKTTILIALERNKEACQTANEAIKLGAKIGKEQMKFICNGKEPKEKRNKLEFFYSLSSFDERFQEW